MGSFLQWVNGVDFQDTKSIYEIMKKQSDRSNKLLEESMSIRNPDLIAKDIGTEKVRHMLQSSTYAET